MSTEAPAADALHPSAAFTGDRELLRDVYTRVLCASEGEAMLDLHERAVALGKGSRAGGDTAAAELERFAAELSLGDAEVLIRSLARWFQLINLAEDNERVRRLQRRARERVWASIEAEHERTRRGLLAVTGCERLLDREPLLRDSIDRRNPYVDPVSFVQIELLRRARAGGDEDDETLSRAGFLAINGIAAGLRNTG